MSNRKIKISSEGLTVHAELNDSATAGQLWDALPIRALANTWGDEIYFSIDVDAELDADANDVVEMGTVAYWPPGNALCLFFGRTPASHGGEIRAASAVNFLGQISDDASVLRQVRSGSSIQVERA